MDRASIELDEAAQQLHAAGRDPSTILHQLLRLAQLHRQLGADLPSGAELAAVRRLPGLGEWDALAAWADDLALIHPEALIAGLQTPDAEERRQRGWVFALAAWLRLHHATPLAARIVRAAEDLALDALNEAAA